MTDPSPANSERPLDAGSRASLGRASLGRASLGRATGVWMAVIVLIVSFAYAVCFQSVYLRRIKAVRPYQGVTYMATDGDRLIPLSCGYRLELADLLWMRSIQSFGGLWRGSREYKSLFNLFFVITDLDPKFIEAYKFGSLVLGDEGGDQEKSIELLAKGMYKNFGNYRCAYEAAYCLRYQMPQTEENHKRALFFATMALKAKDAPDYAARFRDDILSRTGKHEFAVRYSLEGILENADKNQLYLYQIYRRRLLTAINDWQQDSLYQEALRFKERRGRDAASIAELFKDNPDFLYETVDVPRLELVIAEYQAKGMKLADHLDPIMGAATVATHDPPYDTRVFDDAARKGARIPYVIVRGFTSEDKSLFVQSEDDALTYLNRYLGFFRQYLRDAWDKDKKLPARFEEVLPAGQMVTLEPFGGQWVYEPSLMTSPDQPFNPAVFRSSMRPDL